MDRSLFALLVGIDGDRPPVPPLNGRVSDVDPFAAFQSRRHDADKDVARHLRALSEDEATRQAVLPVAGRPLVAPIDGLNQDGARRAVPRLEHGASGAPCRVLPVACDDLGDIRDPAGLKALAGAPSAP